MDTLETIIFGRKSFSSLLEEIYNNQKKKDTQIKGLIQELKPMIKDIGDATLLIPLLKEYLEIGVKNDEQLIKMATIIQRVIQKSNEPNGDLGISESEKRELLKHIDEIGNKTSK